MKKYAFILMISLISYKANAQNDHLEPRGTYGIYGGILFDYFTNNMFQSLESSTDDSLVRFMILPEFEPEKSFYLKKDDSVSYSIHVHQKTVNNLLGKEEYYKITRMGMYRVEASFAEKLIQLFQVTINQTRYPDTNMIDHDGTLHLFTVKDTNGIVRYAEKWSPIDGTHMKEFVSICTSIIECNKIHNNKEQLRILENRIDTLTKALNSNSSEQNHLSTYQQAYDIYRYMNETKDTIIGVKIGETMSAENDSLIGTSILVKNYYVKMSAHSDKYWKNITTGEQNIELVKDKDRGKNKYYAKQRYRILDLR